MNERLAQALAEAIFAGHREAIGVSQGGVHILVNRAYLRLFGYDAAQELLGRSILDLIAPGERARILEFVRRRAAGDRPPDVYESRGLRRDGSEFPMELHVAEHVIDGVTYTVPTLRDLTADKHAAARSDDAQRYLETVLARSPIGVVTYDEQGWARSANPEAARIVGAPLEVVAAQNFRALESWIRSGLRALAEHTLATGEETEAEVDHQTTYGRAVRLVVRFVPFTHGGRRHLLGLFNDVTARDASQRALRESEAQFRAMFEGAPDAMFLADPASGRLLDANPAAAGLTGHPVETLRGLHQAALHPPESAKDRAQFREHAEGLERVMEATVLRADGEHVPVEVRGRLVRFGGREVLLGIFRDLRERRRAETERLDLERRLSDARKLESLGALAGGIAHDFNNLLMGVLGNLDLASAGASGEVRARIDDAISAARRAAQLAGQMLAYSGRGHFVVAPMQLGSLVRDTVGTLAASLWTQVPFEVTVAPDLPLLEADRAQMQQLVVNLVANAAEALAGRPGSVRLAIDAIEADAATLAADRAASGATPGRYLRLSIRDEGLGMDAEALQRAFEPFYSTKAPGRGLGLAAVLGIVRGHRGAVLLHSAPGVGTHLDVLLPLPRGRGPASAATPVALDAEAPPRRSVLVVDDEDFVRLACRRMVERLGYHALMAADGLEAVEVFRAHHTELFCVILDLAMPRLDGLGALRQMAALDATVPVILSSGYNEAAAESQEAFAGFLQKPYGMDDLRRVLRLVEPAA